MYTLLSMKTLEISPKDTTRRTTKSKTQCSLHHATSLQLLASIVQVRKPVVTKEFLARGVRKRTYPVKLALLDADAQQGPFEQQAPRRPLGVHTPKVILWILFLRNPTQRGPSPSQILQCRLITQIYLGGRHFLSRLSPQLLITMRRLALLSVR